MSPDAHFFEEGNIAIICKKLYAQDFKSEFFISHELDQKWFPEKDYPTLIYCRNRKSSYKRIVKRAKQSALVLCIKEEFFIFNYKPDIDTIANIKQYKIS